MTVDAVHQYINTTHFNYW